MSNQSVKLASVLLGLLLAGTAAAATNTYSDNFSGESAKLDWIALGDACLTAGTKTGSSNTDTPIIPACSTKKTSFTYPNDSVGQGALLLTPAKNSQSGAILSDFTFQMSEGMEVTFTTYSFGSTSNGGAANLGADGMVFFLTDGTKPIPSDTGATGGAMGYDCSYTNTSSGKKWNGIENGYLGLGMDEWGNFLNSGDNGGDGALNTNADGAPPGHGDDNGWSSNVTGSPGDSSGPEYQPNRIGMRGAGNVNFKWLNQQNPAYYSSDDGSKVAKACHTGKYLASGTDTSNSDNWKPLPYDYYVIPGAYKALPEDQPLAAVKATNHTDASAWPVTYKVKISKEGLLSFSYSYNNGDFQQVLANTDISNINGTPPSAFRFGFSAGTGGENNVHEITCFEATPLGANSSAGANTVTGKATGNTQFFLASYSSGDWWGSLVADPLVVDASGNVNVGTNANWDAKCVLTGDGNGHAAVCDAMGKDSDGNSKKGIYEAPASRTLLTSTAIGHKKGALLKWGQLSTDEQTALNVATTNDLDTTTGKNRVKWLRGNRTVEQLASGCTATQQATPACDLRARTYVLGDIINSSPMFVPAPTAGALPDAFSDQLHASATNPESASDATKYSAFVSSNASRLNVVYVGGNDGFMHGFEAGVNGNGSFGAANNDGKEVIGYMPYGVLMNKAVNLANPLYNHDYLVDATPVAGDVFYNKTWHTWLVGGVGSNGKEIYALDVTDPSSFAKSDVIGDWDNTTLPNLGNTVGSPIIARMHNGDWAIIFGSGLVPAPASGGTSPDEGVYIGLIDPTDGSVTFRFLDTKQEATGISGADGGIAYVSSVDLDGDHIADYLYAGDTQGNVWRFDVTSDAKTDWKVSPFGGSASAPKPLFVAKDASGNRQPITTAITLLAVRTGLVVRNMLYFGTGQETQQSTTASAKYAKGNSSSTPKSTAQTFYGIWDWDMTAWNGEASTDAQYASLTGTQSITRTALLAQTLQAAPSGDTTDRYLSTTNVVCWEGDTATTQCPTENQYGWMFDLPDAGPTQGVLVGEGEQIIYSPALIGGAVVVNTAIPPKISAADCNPGTQTGWTMAFNPATGGGLPQSFFPNASGSFSSGSSGSAVSGNNLNAVGTPTAVTYNGQSYLVSQTVSGAAVVRKIHPASNSDPSRVSWKEIRK